MATIPKHFKEAFPWITKPPSRIRVNTSETLFIENEIIRLIFRAPVNKLDDLRLPLFKSLKTLSEDQQVIYIKAVAKCLADAMIETPIPMKPKAWLNEVDEAVLNLTKLLKQKPNKSLPLNWGNLLSLFIQTIPLTKNNSNSKISKAFDVIKEENRKRIFIKGSKEAHVKADLITILKLVSHESKELAGKNAITFFKYPQTFFEEIAKELRNAKEKNLFLGYQRRAIKSISTVNQEHFNRPYETLIAYVLTCVFPKKINVQSVINNLYKQQLPIK